MGSSIDVLQVALTSGGSIMTLTAAIRVWLGSRKDRKRIVKIQVDGKEWTVDLSKKGPEEIEKFFEDLAEDLEPEALGDSQISETTPDPDISPGG